MGDCINIYISSLGDCVFYNKGQEIMDRESAEAHWDYTAKLLELAGHKPTELEHFLYVEAMLHGAKHGGR